jgi:hypothetical protein
MFDFVLGVVVGAAFAPFWMKMWDMVKETTVFKNAVEKLKKVTEHVDQ